MKRLWVIFVIPVMVLAFSSGLYAAKNWGAIAETEMVLTINGGIMEISPDCSWLIAAERKILLGRYIMDETMGRTEIVGASLKEREKGACIFNVGDNVVIRGVIIDGEGILALSIRRK